MDRRTFGVGLISAGATSPIVTSVSANEQELERGKRREQEWSRVFLMLPATTQALFIGQLLIVAGELILRYNMQREWQKFALSRANLGAIPLLGELTRPTISKRISRMQPIGQVFLAQATLIVLLDAVLPRAPKSMTIVNDKNEFWTNSKPDRVRWNKNADMFERALTDKVLGAYYDPKTNELLALIPPHLRLE